MNINQLAKSLSDAFGGSRSDHRAIALEVITWLRDNDLLADNSGDIDSTTKLAEQFAISGQEENEILGRLHKILAGEKL